jgi:exosortase/archaeosortase family protein
MLSQLKDNYKKMPPVIQQLVKRVILLIAAWMLLYHLVLQPHRIPDQWLAHVTAKATSGLISAWYHQPTTLLDKSSGTGILINNRNVIFIAYSCDALELYLIYVGFLFCVPTNKKRMLLFGVTGVAVIFLLNVLRCFILTLLNFNEPEWFGFAHHYAFTLTVYAFIFLGWYLYIRKYLKPDAAG